MIRLFNISNAFTMGCFTPWPSRLAMTLVAILLTIVLALTRANDGIAAAIAFALGVWFPLALLWHFEAVQ
jgi:hypothetical protein